MGRSLEQSQNELARLAEGQAALRRVATQVAEGAPPEVIFSTLAEELARLIGADMADVLRYENDGTATLVGGWSIPEMPIPIGSRLKVEGKGPAVTVRETGQPARAEEFSGPAGSVDECFRRAGARSGVGSPIVVEGRLWGVVIAARGDPESLPSGTETRVQSFTELVATAIANAEAREELRRVAAEQAALRRVATLVARATPPAEIFAAVAEEAGNVMPEADIAVVGRYGADRTIEFVGGWSRAGDVGWAGERVPLGGRNVATLVYESNAPARVGQLGEDGTEATGIARRAGARASAGAPISVEGRLWGVMTVASVDEEGLPPGIEERLADFTDLVATAIANTQAREQVQLLADEQAALRRVAELVAEGEPPEAVFQAVAEEVGRLLPSDLTLIARYDANRTVTGLAGWARTGEPTTPTKATLGGRNVTTLVFETGRPARLDSYEDASGEAAESARLLGLRSAVGAPISVEGRLWGLIVASSQGDELLPADAEQRVSRFADLAATAILNAQARDDLRRVADEQAALRRVATGVAHAAPPAEVFASVAEEVGLLLHADRTFLARFDDDGGVTVLADWAAGGDRIAIGSHSPRLPGSVTALVYETGLPAHVDARQAEAAPHSEIRSAVGAPITVEGRLWGVLAAASVGDEPLPPGTEARLAGFAELVATAIANAEAQAELTASRARIVASADETRRRIERDLHDGAQQRLVSLALRLRAVQAAIPPDLDELAQQLDGVARGLNGALDELREFARGIHPAILAEGGLGPALRTLARRSPVPVELSVDTEERLPEPVEVGTYFVVSEALANAAKHAQASRVAVAVEADAETLRIRIGDDGVGGADFRRGSGLMGLKDRVEALGGRIALQSEPGMGTTLSVDLPLVRAAAPVARR